MSEIIYSQIGLGDTSCYFAVYIANQPSMQEYQPLYKLIALEKGDIEHIGKACGNGWRKVFNVYAKLLYSLDPKDFNFSSMAPTWQEYRDLYLLQQGSGTALLFSPPIVQLNTSNDKTLHIICGRTYAKKLIAEGKLNTELTWLDTEFAIGLRERVIVCPYFDYRQLSNIKIERLASIMSDVVNNHFSK